MKRNRLPKHVGLDHSTFIERKRDRFHKTSKLFRSITTTTQYDGC